jgi:hypothetical protein
MSLIVREDDVWPQLVRFMSNPSDVHHELEENSTDHSCETKTIALSTVALETLTFRSHSAMCLLACTPRPRNRENSTDVRYLYCPYM